MNDRKRRIDEFLKYFRDIALQNPGYRLSQRNVYGELTSLGVPPSEKRAEIDQHFGEWMNYFRNDPNCNVFVSPNWRYFCQFVSNDGIARRANEHIKIYVPLDSAHINRGAKEIFSFLSKEGISHLSKIGSHVRFDDVVIRLVNPEDVSKLMNFINNNKYIQDGLMPANPFVFNLNGIPMAVDGSLSFNSTVASFVQIYINDKIDKNALDTVSVDDFYAFVEKYYNEVFANAQGLERLTRDFGEGYLDDSALVNYKNVIELLLKAGKDSFTFDDYIVHYRECSNSSIQRDKIRDIRDIKMGRTPAPRKNTEPDETVDDKVKKTNEMLLTVIDGMVEKYGDQYAVLNNISHYVMSNDVSYITRFKNLRYMVADSSFREDLIEILRNKRMRFMDYAQEVLRQRKQQTITENSNEKEARSTIEKSVILTVQEILEVMTNKYGERTAVANLERFLRTGEPNMITRDFNLRERVVNSSFRMDLREILTQRGLRLSDYLKVVAESKILQSEVYLEQAILTTYDKYEAKFQAGLSRTTGRDFVISSLSQLIEHGEYYGFTRDNNARQNLMNYVSVAEVANIIKKEFGLEAEEQISLYEISVMAEQYIDRVLENNPKRKL